MTKTLKFAPKLVRQILAGEKTSTWRVWDEKNLQAGNTVDFINKKTLKKFAQAKLIEVKEKKFKDLEEKDYAGHQKYSSLNEILKEFNQFSDRSVTPETLVKIIKFKVIYEK